MVWYFGYKKLYYIFIHYIERGNNMQNKEAETDLYEPIKKYFTKLGYEVKAEVKSCDVVAINSDNLIIIELKKSFCLKLVYQAIDRQKITSNVFVAIPRQKKVIRKNYNDMITLCKRLGIGVIIVSLDTKLKNVEVALLPKPINTRVNYKKKKALIKEMKERTFDLHLGGSSGKKLNTAFREKNIKIACILSYIKTSTTKELITTYNCSSDTYSILYNNFYGWFYKVERGVYSLTEKGLKELHNNDFKEIVDFYKDNYPNF
jgi:hypothetical protein